MSTDSINAIRYHVSELFSHVHSRDGLSEIMVNPDGSLWIERKGEVSKTNYYNDSDKTQSLIKMLAGLNDLICDSEHPTLAVRLPDELCRSLDIPGGRVQAVMPPLVSGPMLCIRVPSRSRPTLQELADNGIFEPLHKANATDLPVSSSGSQDIKLTSRTVNKHVAQKVKNTSSQDAVIVDMISGFISKHKNILITGGTGSGKTTFANAILDLIKDERVIIIEDLQELRIKNDDTIYILTKENYSTRDAVFTSLRLRPDRIVVGELRDGKTALELCMAFLTGHRGGQATLHADSCVAALYRLRSLIQQVVVSVDDNLILDSIDVVIHITKKYNNGGTSFKRVVDEIFLVSENKGKIF